jgi:hypothetical protein
VGDESSRQDALQLAVDLGADFVDIELKVLNIFSSQMRIGNLMHFLHQESSAHAEPSQSRKRNF